jgi:hypothetical protein
MRIHTNRNHPWNSIEIGKRLTGRYDLQRHSTKFHITAFYRILWIRSFLENRKQSVILEGTVSRHVPVISSSDTKLFADNSLLYRTINNLTDSDPLQRDLTTLDDWENKWQICIVIRIALKNKQVRQTSYKLHRHTLDNVEVSKYLGVTVNNNLSCDRHIDNIVDKGNKTLGLTSRNLKDCTKPV